MSSEYRDYNYSDAASNTHHPYVYPVLRRYLETSSGPILDLGCGNGWITRALLREGMDIYGVDASESGIRIASQDAPGRFHVLDLSEGTLPGPLQEIPFRTIISTEVIGHLYHPRGLLDFSRRILDKSGGGRLILSTPYHGYLKNLALAVTNKLDDHHCVLWDGGIIKFFSRRTLEQMLNEQGFRVSHFSGAGRFPWFWKSMVLCAETMAGREAAR